MHSNTTNRMLIVGIIFGVILMFSPRQTQTLAQTSQKTDLGDAPTTNNTTGTIMMAYDGVEAKFPTVYADAAGGPRTPAGPKYNNLSGVMFHLGNTITNEADADMGTDEDGVNNINPTADSADNDGGDDGVTLPDTLNHCETVRIEYTVNVVTLNPNLAYLNMWFDWERDGTWEESTAPPVCDNDGSRMVDWAVQNQIVTFPDVGLHTFTTDVKVWNPDPSQDMWVRVTLGDSASSTNDGSGAIGGYDYGEVEDYLWAGQAEPTATRPPDTPTPTATATTKPTTEPRPTELSIEILKSDNKQLEAVIKFPELLTETIVISDETYLQLSLPDIPEPPVGDVSTYGKPAIPMIHRLVAIPKDSTTPTVRLTDLVSEVMSDISLYPLQPSPVDQTAPDEEDYLDFGDRSFQIDEATYRQDSPMPANPVEIRRLGTVRDLDLVLLSIAAGQYNPAKQSLTLFPSFKIELFYQDGKDYFLPAANEATPFENHHINQYDLLLNEETLPNYPGPALDLDLASCVGYEFIIITAPGLRPAADKLATWKWQKGISTAVVETGNGDGNAGNTAEEIVSYIRNEYNRCQVRPSYVMFMGDTKGSNVVPTWYRPWWRWNSDLEEYVQTTIATDHLYSIMNPSPEGFAMLPEIALGRIPARTLYEANTVVDKIINYEKSPPKKSSFYENVSIASYFQCCRPSQVDGTTSRGFIETTEFVRNYLVNQNYLVERIYNTSTGFHDDPTDPPSYYAPNRDATPRFYRLGQLLPNVISPPFVWDGDRADISNAIEDGRFLVQHRGHGSTSSWGSPNYTRNDVYGLNNGSLLPVVFSINCTSGNFDSNGDSIADAFLMQEGGGAVGVIGDTNVSPTWANNALTRGLYDAVWPGFIPNEGSNQSIKRLGDMLNYAKIYMLYDATSPQPATSGELNFNDVWRNVYLYHVIGDPTMEMWTEDPNTYPPFTKNFKTKEQNDTQWTILYPKVGATLTILDEKGQPMGRSIVQENGEATALLLPAVQSAREAARVVASHSGQVSQELREDSSKPIDPTNNTVETEEGRLSLTFPAGTISNSTTISFTGLAAQAIEIEGLNNRLQLIDGYEISTVEPISPVTGIQIKFRIPLVELRAAGIDPYSVLIATQPLTSEARAAFIKFEGIKGESQIVDNDLIVMSDFDNRFMVSNQISRLVLVGLPIQSHRILPTTPNTIYITNLQGYSTTFNIPVKGFPITATLVYTDYLNSHLTDSVSSDVEPGQVFAVNGSDDNGNPVNLDPTIGVTFTIIYSPTRPLPATDIRIYQWNDESWEHIPTMNSGQARQSLTTLTGRFVRFGRIVIAEVTSSGSQSEIYLPLVVKQN